MAHEVRRRSVIVRHDFKRRAFRDGGMFNKGEDDKMGSGMNLMLTNTYQAGARAFNCRTLTIP
jgi:hypothetical protein